MLYIEPHTPAIPQGQTGEYKMNAQIINAILNQARLIPSGCESIHEYGVIADDCDLSDVAASERHLLLGDYIDGDLSEINAGLYWVCAVLRTDAIRAALALSA